MTSLEEIKELTEQVERLQKVADAAEVVSEEHGSECDNEWPLRVLTSVQALRQALEELK